MGTSTRGLDELLNDLRRLPDRCAEKFPRLMGQGGNNIKKDWQARWAAVSHPQGHIPHLIRAVGYDVHERAESWRTTVGVKVPSRQGFLAKIITYGTLTSAPHDAGLAALEAEEPGYVRAVAELARDLLEGRYVPSPARRTKK